MMLKFKTTLLLVVLKTKSFGQNILKKKTFYKNNNIMVGLNHKTTNYKKKDYALVCNSLDKQKRIIREGKKKAVCIMYPWKHCE